MSKFKLLPILATIITIAASNSFAGDNKNQKIIVDGSAPTVDNADVKKGKFKARTQQTTTTTTVVTVNDNTCPAKSIPTTWGGNCSGTVNLPKGTIGQGAILSNEVVGFNGSVNYTCQANLTWGHNAGTCNPIVVPPAKCSDLTGVYPWTVGSNSCSADVALINSPVGTSVVQTNKLPNFTGSIKLLCNASKNWEILSQDCEPKTVLCQYPGNPDCKRPPPNRGMFVVGPTITPCTNTNSYTTTFGPNNKCSATFKFNLPLYNANGYESIQNTAPGYTGHVRAFCYQDYDSTRMYPDANGDLTIPNYQYTAQDRIDNGYSTGNSGVYIQDEEHWDRCMPL